MIKIKSWGILWVLVFGLGISKGCHTILENFQGWSFAFSKISEGKVANLKIPGFFFQNFVLIPRFDFFCNSPFSFLSEVDFRKPLANIRLDLRWYKARRQFLFNFIFVFYVKILDFLKSDSVWECTFNHLYTLSFFCKQLALEWQFAK